VSQSLQLQRVLALDCQATGASPAHGDVIELGWGMCSGGGLLEPPKARFIVPRTNRPVRRAVRELTGWSEACLTEALDEHEAWRLLSDDIEREAALGAPLGSIIHFARFELGFLHDLHQRLSTGGDFPLDVVCLHAIASRLFPELPRRSIRALAGYLGHAPELVRRSSGHVIATAFIWRECLPLLDTMGVSTWAALKLWLGETSAGRRPERRKFPLDRARRLALPEQPGVYRFLRRSGDVLYVGKATSLRKRVLSHFKGKGPTTERALELLTQVCDVTHVVTASVLEAALLECDEIHRLDPPYNVQFRTPATGAWFASRDLSDSRDAPDNTHRIGPLPSRRSLSALGALYALAAKPTEQPKLQAMALGVPPAFLPDEALFLEGWRAFVARHFGGSSPVDFRRLQTQSRALWLERGRTEPEALAEEPTTQPSVPEWDAARVVRRLERSLVQTGLLMRRARWLCLLADATVAYSEREMHGARALTISEAGVRESRDLTGVGDATGLAQRPLRPLYQRQLGFDKTAYDRMRVLLTELHRVHDQGGEVLVCIGSRTLSDGRLTRLLCDV